MGLSSFETRSALRKERTAWRRGGERAGFARPILIVALLVVVLLLIAGALGFVFVAFKPRPSQEPPMAATQPTSEFEAENRVGSPPPVPPVPVQPPEDTEDLIGEATRVLAHLVSRYPREPDALELQARMHFWKKEYGRAGEMWEACLEIAPGYGYAYEGLASIAVKEGDHPKAVELYRKALEINPSSATARRELGRSLLATGAADQAVTTLTAAVNSFPNDADAHYLLGVAYKQQNELQKAKASYSRAVEIEPRYAAAVSGLAQVAAGLGLSDEARQYQDRYNELSKGERYESQRERLQFDDFDAASRDIAELYTNAGRIYLAQRDQTAAELVWRRAAQIAPRDLLSREQLALFYLQIGETQKAIRRLQEMADAYPQEYVLPLQIARIHRRLKEYEEAEQYFEAAIEIDPDRPEAYAELARMYVEIDDKFPRLLRLAQKLVEVSPSAASYELLAGAHERLGDLDQATEAMQQAVDLEPANGRYQQTLEMLKKRTRADE